jgi:hypothetical protein
LPERIAVQNLANIDRDVDPEVAGFIEAILASFPCEIPAAQFPATAVNAACRLLLPFGVTLRARWHEGMLWFRIVATDRVPPGVEERVA